MIKRISNLPFAILLFNCIVLIFMLYAVYINKINLILGLIIIFLCLSLLFSFTSFKFKNNRITIRNYFGFVKTKEKSITLGDVRNVKLITNKFIVSIPGYSPRSGGGRNVENISYELNIIDANGNIILIEKTSKYQWIYKLATVVAESYNIEIIEEVVDSGGISKGHFKGFKQ